MAGPAQFPVVGELWATLSPSQSAGSSYWPWLTGIPFTQPGGPGTTVFPQQVEKTWFAGGVFIDNAGMINGQYVLNCGHSVNQIEYTQYSDEAGQPKKAVACPLCGAIQATGYDPDNLPPFWVG